LLGAIIGDIVGSRFEFNNHLSKEFEFLAEGCYVTDDSIMTLAVAKAILSCEGDWEQLGRNTVTYMQNIGRKYPECGYGNMFRKWISNDNPKPYNSFGNGAAMRVSPCGFFARTEDEAKMLSQKVTEVSHNHPEGLKGAEAVSVAIFLARNGATKDEITERMVKGYYALGFNLDSIRGTYQFDETCQGTVPQAIKAFLESVSFEDAIRNAISIGGDSDTLAAITGSIAEAYYGIPFDIKCKALAFLDNMLRGYYREWEKHFRKTWSVRKFIALTKYIGKLKNDDNLNQFTLDFYNFVQVHLEYDLSKYEDILKSNELKWETDSMKSADVANLDEHCVLALITGVFRADHFSKGVLNEFIKDGCFEKWLNRLKHLDDERKPEEDKLSLKFVKMSLQPFKKGIASELIITGRQAIIKSSIPEGGSVTHQYDFGDSAELGDFCLNAMRDCLETDGWKDSRIFNETEFDAYLYELDAEFEDGTPVTHHGAFNRAHIPEKAFRIFVETIQMIIKLFGFGGIINLDGFMSAIKHGEVKYCGVEYSHDSGIYHYQTTDLRIDVGDKVIVPVSDDNYEQTATVVTVEYCRWDNTPYPLEKTKKIIRKVGDHENKKPTLRFLDNPSLLRLADGSTVDGDEGNK
jgi:ADP-ribosylglycohydrolase